MFADLHIHSYYSDGTNSPKELVEMAAKRNVSVLALSDHDTTEGIEELTSEANLKGIGAVPAVEISTSAGGIRIHILGYFIDCNNTGLKNFLREMLTARAENTRNMLQKLCSSGQLKYSWDEVLKHRKGRAWISSINVFEAMRQDGYYKGIDEWKGFYNRYFSKDSGAFSALDGFTAKDAIEIILQAGGIPVVAHPKLIGDDSQLEALIKYGLRGIEARYPAHDEDDIKRYIKIARQNNLLVTGGTDWHGDFTEWGVALGDCGIDEETFSKLKKGACEGNTCGF